MDALLGKVEDVVGGEPVKCAAYWRGGDYDSCPVTVTAQVTGERADLLRPFIRITWGIIGQHHVTAEVDVGRGQQVVVGGNSVEVSVGADAVLNVPTKGTIIAMLNFGAPSFQAPATRTVYFDDLNKDVSVTRLIPAFARELLPLQVSHPVALKISFLDSLDRVLAIVGMFAKEHTFTPIPVPADAVKFSVKNLNDESVAVRAPFSLAIGGGEVEAGAA